MAKVHDLGLEMHVAVFAILDAIDEAGAARLTRLVIERVGMTPVLKPAVWRYPLPHSQGIGGVGETAVQPFVMAQPLAESLSLAVTDTWHEHRGFYLILCSCRPFNATGLWRWLKKRGWKVIDADTASTTLLRKTKESWLRRWLSL